MPRDPSITALPADLRRRFHVERLHATGGFGAVYVARQRGLGRRVAIKVLRPEVLAHPDLVARFRSEARITASLAHPSIVIVLDHGLDDGVPWIAYEFLPGPTLREVLSGGPFPWPQALEVGVQVAGALEEAHGRGVLHRDVKPDNVIEAGPGLYKVADFGIATWLGEAAGPTQAGVIVGTPEYLAPELVGGKPASPSCDLYALGCLLYELATGRPPYTGVTPVDVLRAHVEAPVPLLRPLGLPEGVDALVGKALAKSPADRFGTARAMREALERELARPRSKAEARNVRTRVVTADRHDVPSLAPTMQASTRRPRSRARMAGVLGLTLGALAALVVVTVMTPIRTPVPPPSVRSPAPPPPVTAPPGLLPADVRRLLAGRLDELERTLRSIREDWIRFADSLSSPDPDAAVRREVEAEAARSDQLYEDVEAGWRFVTPVRDRPSDATDEEMFYWARMAYLRFDTLRLSTLVRRYRSHLADRMRGPRGAADGYHLLDMGVLHLEVKMAVMQIPEPPETLTVLVDGLTASRVALRRAAALAYRADRLGPLVMDTWNTARAAVWLRWPPGLAPRARAEEKAYLASFKGLPGPLGLRLGDAVVRLWGVARGDIKDDKDLATLAANLKALRARAGPGRPAAAWRLETGDWRSGRATPSLQAPDSGLKTPTGRPATAGASEDPFDRLAARLRDVPSPW